VDIAVCPTFVHLVGVLEAARDGGIAVGSQDVSEHAEGAYTGEVAAWMLAELGCLHAIVGHSERRAHHGESDPRVAAKCCAAREAGLAPIVCVGESIEQRDEGATLEVVARQLDAVLAETGPELFAGAVVAYEPIWAIGTGRTATPEQAQEVHHALRGVLADAAPDLGARTRILYGGSVKSGNAGSLFAMPDIDGALVGGASLDAEEFLAICDAAAHAASDG
jgi:triosephosphate isomerase